MNEIIGDSLIYCPGGGKKIKSSDILYNGGVLGCMDAANNVSLNVVIKSLCTEIANSQTYIEEGTNITITGSGTSLDPWIISSSGGVIIESDPIALAKTITLNAGSGISITGTASQTLSSNPSWTVINSAPDQVVVLNEGSNITITGTYPNFTIAASGGGVGTDELIKVSSNDTTAGYLNGKLVQGTGILLTENNDGANETFTVAHADTSSVSNLDTSAAQVIDTLTFDTFGHVLTVATRDLTLADLGYTVPNAYRFGVSGEDDTATQARLFSTAGFDWELNFDVSNYFKYQGYNNSKIDYLGTNGTFYSLLTLDASNGLYVQVDRTDVSGSGGLLAVINDQTYLEQVSPDGTTGLLNNYDGSKVYSLLAHTQSGFSTGYYNDKVQGVRLGKSPSVNNTNLEGIQVWPSKEIVFHNYPSTRNDGNTAKALFISNSTGDVKYGNIVITSTSVSDFNEAVDDRVDALIVDGTGITTSYNDGAGTLTITNSDLGSSQNIFKNVAVSGQNTVIADSNNDTLTLVAGTNITITTDDTTDTITINSTSGGSGTVNTGAQYKAAYYPSAGTTVDDWIGVEFGQTNLNTKITAQATTEVPLEIKLAASQTANAFEINSDAGTGGNLIRVTKDGYLRVPTGAAGVGTGAISFNGHNIEIFSVGYQVGFYNHGNGLTAAIGNAGLFLKNTTDRIYFGNGSLFSNSERAYVGSPASGSLELGLSSVAKTDMIFKLNNNSGTDQTGFNLTVQSGAGTGSSTSGGSILLSTPDVLSTGTSVQTFSNKVQVYRTQAGKVVQITPQHTGDVPLEIKGIAAQTANFLNISSSSGTGDIMQVQADGDVSIDGNIFFLAASSNRVRLAGDDSSPQVPVHIGAIGGGTIGLTTATLAICTPIGGSGPAYIVAKHGASGPETYFGSEGSNGLFGTFTNHDLHLRSNNITRVVLKTTGELSLGIAGTRIGILQFSGNTSGTITMQPQAAAGTYNFNLPTTAGTSGYLLTSAGGGSNAMTWTNPATLGGGGGYTVHEIDNTDSPYTISETSGEIVVLVDASAGAVTVNLPTAVGNTAKYNIKLVADGNTLTIDADGTETIDGSLTAAITVENVTVTLVNNNANWFII